MASSVVVGCTQTATGIDFLSPELEAAIPESTYSIAESQTIAESQIDLDVAPAIAITVSADQIGVDQIGVDQIDFEICSESPDWMRLAESDQLQQLRQIPRYGAAIEEEPWQSLVQNFWLHEAISFTTYGLSARIEPLYFSGLWTIVDTLSSCYEGSRSEEINAGQMAEVWLINHQVNQIQWDGNRYLMNVQTTGEGVQLIQFPRQERQTTLPLTVVTEDKTEIAVLSGDWQ